MSPDPPGASPEPRYTTGPLRWRAPVGRHRDSGRARVGRWLAALATGIVVVAVGGAVANSELSTDERFREIVVTGAMGEWVSGRTFEVNVLAVRAAATISTEPGVNLDTAGVWVLARIRAMAVQVSTWLGYASVRDSAGRVWTATERIDQALVNSGYRLDPRIPVEGEIAFEVPRDAATDLTLWVGEGSNGLYGFQMATMVEVPLSVDEAMVAGGLAATEPAEIGFPEIVIADPQLLEGGDE
jgi:hypothetical protein